jgi:hypothetical protein
MRGPSSALRQTRLRSDGEHRRSPGALPEVKDEGIIEPHRLTLLDEPIALGDAETIRHISPS